MNPKKILLILPLCLLCLPGVLAGNPTGGNITYDGNYTIHTFWANGTFNSTGTGVTSLCVLVLAGGGAGGGSSDGGGGGAGGLIYNCSYTLAEGVYPVVVGLGGIGSAGSAVGKNGQNSFFNDLNAVGGGGGGSGDANTTGANGGSGGGNGYTGTGATSNGTVGQGNSGGKGFSSSLYFGGGGGGKGQPGSNGTAANGFGGNGTNYSINGSNINYAGGGGGGGYGSNNVGGIGGGGHGADSTGHTQATNGTNGLGGGGGGSGQGTENLAGSGGSGVVIIRHLTVSNTSLDVTLISPADNTTANTANISFVYNVTSSVNLSNCTLYLNGIGNGSSNNGLANGQYTFNRTISDGVYAWKVGCLDANIATNTTSRNLTVNTTRSLAVTLVSPADLTTSNITENILTYNVAGTANLSNCSLFVNNTLNSSNNSLPNGQYTFNVTSGNLTSFAWFVQCTDIYNTTNSSTWTLFVDTRPPPNMSILNVSVKDYLGVQLSNFSIIIDNSYSINVENNTRTTKTYLINQNVGCTQQSYTFTPPDANINMTSTRISFYWPTSNLGANVTFTYLDGTSSTTVSQGVVQAPLWVQLTFTNPNMNKYVKNITYAWAPGSCYGDDTARIDDATYTALSNGFYAIGNVTAGTHQLEAVAPGYAYGYANVTTTGANTYYSFTLYQQNTFNFTIYDESTNTLITENFSIKLISDVYSANYTTGTGTLNVTLLLPSEYQIIYNAVSNTSDYPYPRSYYATITNGSYQNIRLYAISQSNSQYLVPTVKDHNGRVLENATIILIRGQIEGNAYVGYTVEMTRTDSEGRGLFRIIPNTVYYKFFITHPAGTLTTNYFKITSATITFQLGTGTNPLTSFQNIINTARTIGYNNATQTFYYNYLDNTNTITQGCLEVQKTDQYGVNSILTNTCNNGSVGSIIYTITDTNNSVYHVYGRLSTSDGVAITDTYEQSFTTSYSVFGLVGIVITIMLYLFFLFAGAPSAEGTIIGGCLAIVIVGVFGIMAWSWTAFIGIVIIAGVTVYYMNKD